MYPREKKKSLPKRSRLFSQPIHKIAANILKSNFVNVIGHNLYDDVHTLHKNSHAAMIPLGSIENISRANKLILSCLRNVGPTDLAWHRPTGSMLAVYMVVKSVGSGVPPAGQPRAS